MIVEDQNFKANKTIVACHIICNNEVLFLLRNPNKPQGSTYGTPAGKLDEGETPDQAIIREVYEETEIPIRINDLEFKKIFHVAYDDFHFDFYVYHLHLDTKPQVHVNGTEHTEYIWCNPKDALKLSLIEDEDNVLKELFNLSN